MCKWRYENIEDVLNHFNRNVENIVNSALTLCKASGDDPKIITGWYSAAKYIFEYTTDTDTDTDTLITYLSPSESIEHYIRQFSQEYNRRYIPIDELRNFVSKEVNYSKSDFDKALFDLARSSRIQLLHGDPDGKNFDDLLFDSSFPNIPYVNIELLYDLPESENFDEVFMLAA